MLRHYTVKQRKNTKESSATNCHLKEKNFALDFGAATYLSFMESIVKVYHEKLFISIESDARYLCTVF